MNPVVSVHLLGLLLGLGGATTADLVVVRALRRRRMTAGTLAVVQRASRLIWVGMAMLAGSGLVFVATGSPATARFWTKLLVVAVACGNGRLVHRQLLPALRQQVRDGAAVPSAPLLQRAGAAAAVSAASWWGAVLLGAWRSLSWSVPELVAAYLVVATTAAIAGSWIAPRIVRAPSPPVSEIAPERTPVAAVTTGQARFGELVSAA